MKEKVVITFFDIVAFAIGCKPAADKSSAQINLDAATAKVETKTKQPVEATREFAAAIT